MQRTRKRAVVIGLSGLAAGALVLPAAAWATGATPSPSGSATASASPDSQGPDRHRSARGGPGGAELVTTLASELGVTEQKVRDALAAVRAQLGGPAHRPGDRPTEAEREASRAEFTKALAARLGVTEQRLTAALDKARAAERADHTARLKQRLDAAVKAGEITQADADAVLRVADAGVLGGWR
jgi:hypothetical protein